jgi:hypothetical protein
MTDEPDLPSMGTRIVNAAKSVKQIAKHAVDGGSTLVDAVEQDVRKSICEANVCGMYRESDHTCAECGCELALKIPLMAMYCPQLLWPGDELKHEISGETDGEEEE